MNYTLTLFDQFVLLLFAYDLFIILTTLCIQKLPGNHRIIVEFVESVFRILNQSPLRYRPNTWPAKVAFVLVCVPWGLWSLIAVFLRHNYCGYECLKDRAVRRFGKHG